MRRHQLTLLQRGVVQRLREANYNGLADAARDAWGHGERVNMPNYVHPLDALLREDFDKANGQVAQS